MIHLQNVILEMVAKGVPLGDTMYRLCTEVEKELPDVICSVLSVDNGRLRPLAAPSLPEHYSAAIDGLGIGPNVGSCGTAAYFATPVAVTDIETDPRWADYKSLPLPLGLRACWSSPISDGRGRVIGTFAFYYKEKRGPNEREREAVNISVHLCAIALERHEYAQEWERRAHVDVLTSLPNRASFDLDLARLPCAEAGAWALLLLDLDNLKTVNDTFGHSAGDCLLRAAATRIASASAPDKAYRLGGDEFAVLLQSRDALDRMDAAVDRILQALAEPTDCGGHIVVPKATVGGAVLSADDPNPEMVRKHADFALYHAKETRRGGFVRYWPGIGTAMLQRLGAIEKLDSALQEHRVDAFYQPVVRMDTGETVGIEALCRLTTPSGEILPAAAFHQATSDAHLAARLTQCMAKTVAADMRGWLDSGIDFQHVAINVTSADFHGQGLPALLTATFEKQGVPLDRVVVEVTEAVYMGHREDLVARGIDAIRANNVRVALDDFGTGFASLTHLLTVPVDIIKIDKSFIARLDADAASATIVEALLWIGGKLGIAVIAEGIETERQMAQLKALGCVFGQGYLFSRPVPRDTITQMMLGRADKQRQGQSCRA